MNEISPVCEKKFRDHQLKEKLGKITSEPFDETISLPEPKFYPRIYGDCNSL